MAAVTDKPTATTLSAATTPSPAATIFDEMLQEHFAGSGSGSGSAVKWRKTWLEFNCQKGHHYGRYATYQNGKKTRKITGGGYVGDFRSAIERGERRRVVEFIKNHNCHYPEALAGDVRKYGLGSPSH